MKRMIQTFIVTVVLLCMCLPSSLARAEESSDFSTSNYDPQNISIRFEGTNILFLQFPKQESFRYVMLSLYGEDDNVYKKATYSTSEAITFSTANVPDGTYYIQVYRAPERYTTFWSYFYKKKGIRISVQNGIPTRMNSPVYEENAKLFQNNRMDEAALRFYQTPSGGVESEDEKIVKLAHSIVQESDRDYDKLKKVHDWVAQNVWYDYDSYYSGSYGSTNALGVLDTKRSVCQGYANLTAALLRALGIPTKVVSGYALGVSTNGEWTDSALADKDTNHAWNEAYVDGRWIILDTTWDSNNRYEKTVFSSGTGVYTYRYFDPTIEMFSYDHRISSDDSEIIDYESALDYFSHADQKMTLYHGGTKNSAKQLTVKIDEENINTSDWTISYSSSNPGIATVDKYGQVKAKEVGKATITITVTAGYAKKVMKTSVLVEKPRLEFTKTVKKLKAGSRASFQVKSYGLQAAKWSSSNPSVLTVSSKGKVVARKAGTATITAQSGTFKKSMKVVVTTR